MFSKKVFVVLVVYLTSNYSNAQKDKKFFRNDYHYLEGTESFYKISSYPKTWAETKRACALEGAILWYPDHQEEADAVISYWNSTQPTWWSVYVGLSDLLVKGQFETIDGKRAEDVFQNWNKGEPNNYQGIEGCVTMTANSKILDVSCDKKHPFICKKSLQSLEWNQLCNMPDLGYTYNEKNSRCYKLHSTPLNWTEAYNVCSSEQAYLIVINNWSEVDLVKLTQNEPKNYVADSYLRGLYHVGFHNRYNDNWSTVKGAAINGSIPWWGNQQPTVGIHDQCGAMFYTGRMTQIDCGAKCFFICEHEVDFSYLNRNNEDDIVLQL